MITPSDKKRAAVDRTIRDFRRFFSLPGGLVLEIASMGNAVPEHLLNMGAESVICSNLRKNAQVVQSAEIHYVMADATAAGFASGAFDVVFGRALLEHINHIPRLRDEVTRLLKPGGVFFLDGGPMWCSPQGHHLWLRAPSGRDYRFSDDDCPVRDWEHLLLSKEEMLRALEERHVDEGDAQAIAHYIYHTTGQNRLSTSEICEDLSRNTILDVVTIKDDVRIAPPADLLHKYDKHDLITSRVVIAGRKKAFSGEPDVFSGMPKGTREEEDAHRQGSRARQFVTLRSDSRRPAGRPALTGSHSVPGQFYWRMRDRVAAYVVRRHPRLARLYRRLRYGWS